MKPRSFLKKLVLKLNRIDDFSYIDEVYDPQTGSPSKRWVLMLPGAGCQWAKEGGGCYMCGFKHQTDHLKGKKDGPPVVKMRIAYLLGKYFADVARQKPSSLAIYNGGSYLNDNEIPKPIQLETLRKVSAEYPTIKNILVESRPEFINSSKLSELRSALGNKCSLTIGIGLECQSDLIRHRCINKGFTRGDYERAISLLKGAGVGLLTYVFLKPIMLTERSAIREAIATIKYAFDCGSDVVALNSAFIQEGTVMCKFYKSGRFRPPWLWSILSVVTECAQYGPIHIGSFRDEPAPIAVPYNCPNCSETVMRAIADYNSHHDLSVFSSLDCPCKEQWEEEVGL